MAVQHMLYTPEQAARSTLAALRYQSTLAKTITSNYGIDFVPGRGARVTVPSPVMIDPARVYTQANRRAEDAITYSELYQPYTSVEISDQVYNAVKLPDDFVTFTLASMEQQVIAPMARSVAERINAIVVAALETTPEGLTAADTAARGTVVGRDGKAYNDIKALRAANQQFAGFGAGATVKASELKPTNRAQVLKAIRAAHQLLSQRGVPPTGRYLAVGANWEAALMATEQLTKANEAGTDGLLRDATIGRIFGFTVVVDYTLEPSTAFAYSGDAIALVTRTTAAPRGAAFASTVAESGFTLRYLHDYDPDHLQDRAVIDTFAGAQLLDGQRIVRLKGTATMADDPASAAA